MVVDEDFADLPPIPPKIWTRDQQEVDTRGDKWGMCSSIWGGRGFNINWQRVKDKQNRRILSKRALHLTALYVIHQLQRQQTRTAAGDLNSILHFERWLATQVEQGFFQFDAESFNWSDLTEAVVIEYVADCENTSAKGGHFITVRSLYQWGIDQEYQDFDKATFNVLRSISAMFPVSGHIVRSWDPEKGPLAPDEKWLLKQALRQKLGQQRDRILIQILLELGLRPQAMLLLRSQDLRHYEVHGAVRYELAVTTIKRRTQERETKGYPISSELGRLLEQQQCRQPDAPLLHWLPQAQPDTGIRRGLRRFVKEANILSPITGNLLYLHPYRLRYTLATYLFELGAPIAAIAAALGHKGTRKAWIYIKTTAALADKIAQALDPAMEPLVHRFLGQAFIDTIPSGCQNLILNAVPHLQHLQTEIGVVGICKREQPEDCQRAQPLACYLCPSFAALKGGPHQDLLEAIKHFTEQGQGKVSTSILRQHDDVQMAMQQLLKWMQPDFATSMKQTETVEVNTLAHVIDHQTTPLPLVPSLPLPPVPELSVVDSWQKAEANFSVGAV